jgi:uncharacterized protein (DUF58 family)
MTFGDWLATCETALTLHTTAKLRQEQPGTYRSVHLGKGVRLHHHEEYQPGDERRFIDWKVSRKEHTLLLRRFEAEKRLEVVAVCDVSPSMLFGRQVPKQRIVLDCAGVLGLAALRQGSAFGLLAFAAETVAHFPPRQQRSAVLQALEYLWRYTPSGDTRAETRLAPVLRHLPSQRPMLVCMLSDFRTPDWQETLDILSATHDTIAVLIEDEAETSLEALGRIVVHDLESGRFVELDTASAAYCRAYHAQMLAERAAREQLLQRLCGSQYIVASHATDYCGELLRLFLARMAGVWV